MSTSYSVSIFKNAFNHVMWSCWLWYYPESQSNFSLEHFGVESTQKNYCNQQSKLNPKHQGLCNCMARNFGILNLALFFFFWFVKILFEYLWQNSHILLVLKGKKEERKEEGRKEERQRGKKEGRKVNTSFWIEVFLPSVLLVYLAYLHPCHWPQITLSPGLISPLACQEFF